MKLLDANILLYAYHLDSPLHDACRTWLEATFNGAERVGLPWQTLLAFVRIAPNPRAVAQPLTVSHACALVDRWLQQPNVTAFLPTERFWPLLREHLLEGRITGLLVIDAALAARALEHGAMLCSTDRDFRGFRDLILVDSLEHEAAG